MTVREFAAKMVFIPFFLFIRNPKPTENKSDLSGGTAWGFCVFLGGFGAHYFYVNKLGMGLLYLFTGGLGGIGTFIDAFRIAYGGFTDSKKRKLDAVPACQVCCWMFVFAVAALFILAIRGIS
jgi:TM2 domain-containing membrane protein YozV